jgi:GntR family transcriptional regulator
MQPAWVQIEEELAARIGSGELAVGERLEPERDLARRMSVSRMTVRQALASLSARGLIERGVGRGTFVARPKVEHDHVTVAGFTEQMERAGLRPGARVLSAQEEPAPPGVARALQMPPDGRAAHVRRLRFGGRVPLTLEDTWIPSDRFPGLVDLDLRGSLYALMRDLYQHEPVRAVERLEPVLARTHEARELDVPPRSALMRVERTAFDASGMPVEYARDLHRGDRASFVVSVQTTVPPGG